MKKITALLLCIAVLFLNGCQYIPHGIVEDIAEPEKNDSGVSLPDFEPYTVSALDDFDDFVYEKYNMKRIDTLVELFAAADSADRLIELYNYSVSEIKHIYTLLTYSNIMTYCNMSDSYWSDRYEIDTVNATDAYDSLCEAIATVCDGEYGEELAESMEYYDSIYLPSYEPLSERAKELMKQESELLTEYYTASAEQYSVNYAGKDWTLNDLYYDNTLSNSEYYDLYYKIMRKSNAVLSVIYMKLVGVRNELATEMGYDNYHDYCYENTYGRGYDSEDIEKYREYIKEYIVPVIEEINGSGQFSYSPDFFYDDFDELLEICRQELAVYMPEIVDIVDYIDEHNLYNDNYSANGYVGSFACSLPDYDSAYIYSLGYNATVDYTNICHEIGHYSNFVLAPYNDSLTVVFDLDISETQSTSLENIMVNGLYDIIGNYDAKQGIRYQLYNSLYVICSACAVDEFECYAYNNPEADTDTLNAEYARIQKSYGVDDWLEGCAWSDIPHIYSTPFYYISYAVAGLASQSVAKIYVNDNQRGCELYLDILKTTVYDGSYEDFCDEYNLWYITDEQDVSDAADYFSRRIGELTGAKAA